MTRPQPHHEPRRRDRAKDDAWIRRFLEVAPTGALATVSGDRPFLNSNLFVLDPDRHCLYLHTARTGRTPSNVAEGGVATFSAWVMGRLLPAAEALEFSVEYSAAVVFGQIQPVEAEEEKRHALQLIMEKYAPHLTPGTDYRPITQEELGRTAVHRLTIEEWSGKEKVEATDFPGAYTLPPVRPPAAAQLRMDRGGSDAGSGEVRIASMAAAYWDGVSRIYAEGIATGHATFETEVPDWEGWNTAHSPSARIVALDGDQVIGWAAVSPVSGRCVYGGVAEVSVYVAADRRGQGIGSRLLEALVRESEAVGIWTLQAGIFPENRGSVRLHLRAGFRPVGVRERLGKLHGRWRDVLLLERRSGEVGT